MARHVDFFFPGVLILENGSKPKEIQITKPEHIGSKLRNLTGPIAQNTPNPSETGFS